MRGEQGWEWGWERKVPAGAGITGTGKGRRERPARAGRALVSRVGRAKKRTLVGDVPEYWGLYEGEGAY